VGPWPLRFTDRSSCITAWRCPKIHRCGGLVEEEHIGIVEQGAGQEQPLLLPARQRPDVAIGEVLKFERVEERTDP